MVIKSRKIDWRLLCTLIIAADYYSMITNRAQKVQQSFVGIVPITRYL